MHIGISTASMYGRSNVEDSIAEIAACGADLCEVFLNTYSEYTPEFVDILRERLRAASITAYSVHPMGTQFEPQLFSAHQRQREDALKMFERILMGAQKIGASCYTMHGPSNLGGRILSHVRYNFIGPITRDLCAMAKDYGVRVAWENVSWCLFRDPEFGLRLRDAAKTEDLFFTLDVKQALRSGHEPDEFIETVGDKMINLHLCDYVRENNDIRLAMPGQGQFDFADLAHKMLACGYAGPAFVEVYSMLYETLPELETSFRYLEDVMR